MKQLIAYLMEGKSQSDLLPLLLLFTLFTVTRHLPEHGSKFFITLVYSQRACQQAKGQVAIVPPEILLVTYQIFN